MNETKLLPPFAGMRARPYSQDMLKNVDWYSIKPVTMLVEGLWLTQSHLNIEGVLGKRFSNDSFPRAVRTADKVYLEDGHHRVVLAVYNKAKFVYVRIYDLPEL